MSAGTHTRQKLVATALELLWRNSYGSVSVDDICKAADVRKGSFYHFFPSKVDLTLAAMDEEIRRSDEAYGQVFTADTSPARRFENLTATLLEQQAHAAETFGRVCGCPVTSLASELAGQSEFYAQKFEELVHTRARYFETAISDMVIEGTIPRDTDVKAMAREIHDVILSAMVLARIQNDLAPLGADLRVRLNHALGINLTTV
ncbi:TetR/AcrR family transcriptional regulator [Plantactinospora sp. WMMB334]|uniref:TetR/AcrR family transcriptional regulator n=1 Tax=Plantactinospora sp. WMMB334 TaxID=3404119 RepID=UPI003B963740